jgi:hypothetical protein
MRLHPKELGILVLECCVLVVCYVSEPCALMIQKPGGNPIPCGSGISVIPMHMYIWRSAPDTNKQGFSGGLVYGHLSLVSDFNVPLSICQEAGWCLIAHAE